MYTSVQMAKLSAQLQEVKEPTERMSRTERQISQADTAEKKEIFEKTKAKISDMSLSEYESYYKTMPSWLKSSFSSPTELNKYRQEQISEEEKKLQSEIIEARKSKERFYERRRIQRDRGEDEKAKEYSIKANFYQALENDLKRTGLGLIQKGYTAKSVKNYVYKKQKKGYEQDKAKLERTKAPEPKSYDASKPSKLITITPTTTAKSLREKGYSFKTTKSGEIVDIRSPSGKEVKETQYIRQDKDTYKLKTPLLDYSKIPESQMVSKITSKEVKGTPTFSIETRQKIQPISYEKLLQVSDSGTKRIIEKPQVYGSVGVVDFLKKYGDKPFYYTKTGEAKFIKGDTKEEQIRDAEKNLMVGAYKNVPLSEVKDISPIEYAKIMESYGYGSQAWDTARVKMYEQLPSDYWKLPPREQAQLGKDIEKTIIAERSGKSVIQFPAYKVPIVRDITEAIIERPQTTIQRKSYFREQTALGKSKFAAYSGFAGLTTVKTMESFSRMPVELGIIATKYTGIGVGKTISGTGKLINALSKKQEELVYKYTGKQSKAKVRSSTDFEKISSGITKSFSSEKPWRKIRTKTEPFFKSYRKDMLKGYYGTPSSVFKTEEETLKAYNAPYVSVSAGATEAVISLYFIGKAGFQATRGAVRYSSKYGWRGYKPSVLFRSKKPVSLGLQQVELPYGKSINYIQTLEKQGFASADDIAQTLSKTRPRKLPAKWKVNKIGSVYLQPYEVKEVWSIFDVKTAKRSIVPKKITISSVTDRTGGFQRQLVSARRLTPKYVKGKVKWTPKVSKEYRFISGASAKTKGVAQKRITLDIPEYAVREYNINGQKFKIMELKKYTGTSVKKSDTARIGTEPDIFKITPKEYKSLTSSKAMRAFEKKLILEGRIPTTKAFYPDVYDLRISPTKKLIAETPTETFTLTQADVTGRSVLKQSNVQRSFYKYADLDLTRPRGSFKAGWGETSKYTDTSKFLLEYDSTFDFMNIKAKPQTTFLKSVPKTPKKPFKIAGMDKIDDFLKKYSKTSTKIKTPAKKLTISEFEKALKKSGAVAKQKPSVKVKFDSSLEKDILRDISKRSGAIATPTISSDMFRTATRPASFRTIREAGLGFGATLQQQGRAKIGEIGASLRQQMEDVVPETISRSKLRSIPSELQRAMSRTIQRPTQKPVSRKDYFADTMEKQTSFQDSFIKQMNKNLQKSMSKTIQKSKTKTMTKSLTLSGTATATGIDFGVIPTPTKVPIIVPPPFFDFKTAKLKKKKKDKKSAFERQLAYSSTLSGVIAYPKAVKISRAKVPELLSRIQTGIEIRKPYRIV